MPNWSAHHPVDRLYPLVHIDNSGIVRDDVAVCKWFVDVRSILCYLNLDYKGQDGGELEILLRSGKGCLQMIVLVLTLLE